MPRLSQDQRQEAVASLASGSHPREIAQRYGISLSAAYQLHPERGRITPRVPSEVLREVAAGERSVKEVAEMYRVSLSAIYQRMRALGMARHPSYRRVRGATRAIERLTMEGYSEAQIIERTGLSRGTVQRARAAIPGDSRISRMERAIHDLRAEIAILRARMEKIRINERTP